jgi:hypothetical protein
MTPGYRLADDRITLGFRGRGRPQSPDHWPAYCGG